LRLQGLRKDGRYQGNEAWRVGNLLRLNPEKIVSLKQASCQRPDD